MYENGEGVAKNAVTAYVWYSLAAAKGFKLGLESVEKLKAKLTQAQIAEATKLATQCKESGYKDCNL
jgi:TPR repeat protein